MSDEQKLKDAVKEFTKANKEFDDKLKEAAELHRRVQQGLEVK